MAFLFQINDKSLFPNPETLLIEPFKSIWARDRTSKKSYAIEDFSYIEFMSSMKKSNPYKDYPADRKHDVIVYEVITRDDWEIDELIQAGIKKLEELQKEGSTNYRYYIAAKCAVEKMENFFLEVDLNDVNEKGALLYKPKDITTALNDTERVMTGLNSLKKKVEEEVYETTKTRAAKVISPFANPNSLNKK